MNEQYCISLATIIFSLVIFAGLVMGFSFIIFRHSIVDELGMLAWIPVKLHPLPAGETIVVMYDNSSNTDWINYKDYDWFYAGMNGKRVDEEKLLHVTHFSYVFEK